MKKAINRRKVKRTNPRYPNVQEQMSKAFELQNKRNDDFASALDRLMQYLPVLEAVKTSKDDEENKARDEKNRVASERQRIKDSVNALVGESARLAGGLYFRCHRSGSVDEGFHVAIVTCPDDVDGEPLEEIREAILDLVDRVLSWSKQ